MNSVLGRFLPTSDALTLAITIGVATLAKAALGRSLPVRATKHAGQIRCR